MAQPQQVTMMPQVEMCLLDLDAGLSVHEHRGCSSGGGLINCHSILLPHINELHGNDLLLQQWTRKLARIPGASSAEAVFKKP